jgi:hypothetical protein
MSAGSHARLYADPYRYEVQLAEQVGLAVCMCLDNISRHLQLWPRKYIYTPVKKSDHPQFLSTTPSRHLLLPVMPPIPSSCLCIAGDSGEGEYIMSTPLSYLIGSSQRLSLRHPTCLCSGYTRLPAVNCSHIIFRNNPVSSETYSFRFPKPRYRTITPAIMIVSLTHFLFCILQAPMCHIVRLM